MKASKKRFRIGAQSNPVEFMSWLLNTLHGDLRNSKKNTSIIYECFQVPSITLLSKFVTIFSFLTQIALLLWTWFSIIVIVCPQGELEVVKEIPKGAIAEKKESSDDQNGGSGRNNISTETSKMPFLMLGLDLPPPPLFKDVMEKNIIPQVQYALCCWLFLSYCQLLFC